MNFFTPKSGYYYIIPSFWFLSSEAAKTTF